MGATSLAPTSPSPHMYVRTALYVVILATVFLGAGVGVANEGRPYRAYLTSTARDGLAAPNVPSPATPLPALPAGWPLTFQLGTSDSPGGASRAAENGLGFRYQYLAGGVNTGNGWATWEPDAAFVTQYIADSRAAGVIPVFSYYMLRQSLPGARDGESEGVAKNLANPETMRTLFDDLERFFDQAGAAGGLTILHFEPDLWGYVQQRSTDDLASGVSVSVASTGSLSLAGLPNTAAGLAQGVLRLRDLHAPNVLVAYHLSLWGTGVDPVYANPGSSALATLVRRSATFYASLDARFDITFAEMSDRDAGFKQHVYGDGGASWWDEGDFARHVDYLRAFTMATQTRIVLWQVPQGNTVMRSMNNTWNHFQDNKVEWLLGDDGWSRLRPYISAGVVALLFGRGADGATCACDANGDGVSNPPPINGNLRVAVSSDDDGGYFDERRAAFADSPGLPLP